MNKEQQIKELANCLDKAIDNQQSKQGCFYLVEVAATLYEAGYRKQADVAREFAMSKAVKPVIEESVLENGAQEASCGECGEALYTETPQGDYTHREWDYCPYCGTKIDWEE